MEFKSQNDTYSLVLLQFAISLILFIEEPFLFYLNIFVNYQKLN